MVRTIEQILGAQPLNQKVAAATPMYGAFRPGRPHAVRRGPEPGPAHRGRQDAARLRADTLGTTGAAARKLNARVARKVAIPAAQQDIAAQWEAWRQKQRFTGPAAVPDHANPAQMNRSRGTRRTAGGPLPGRPKVYAPARRSPAATSPAPTGSDPHRGIADVRAGRAGPARTPSF